MGTGRGHRSIQSKTTRAHDMKCLRPMLINYAASEFKELFLGLPEFLNKITDIVIGQIVPAVNAKVSSQT